MKPDDDKLMEKLKKQVEDHRISPEEVMKKQFAEYYFNAKCGMLHLGWAIDTYWTMVCNKVFIPGLLSIHQGLVEKEFSEKNTCSWGDADGDLYYIPCKDKKVIVFTTQNRDYLFILGKRYSDEEKYSLHIRRVWPKYKAGDIWNLKEAKKNVLNILDNVETFEQYSDDHSEYPQRPSIDMYKKIKFNLDDYQSKPRFYGDIRDAGYIISYCNRWEDSRAEGTVGSFYELDILAKCNLGVMASEIDIELPMLNGY